MDFASASNIPGVYRAKLINVSELKQTLTFIEKFQHFIHVAIYVTCFFCNGINICMNLHTIVTFLFCAWCWSILRMRRDINVL